MTDHINPTIYDDNMFNSYFQWDSDSAAPFDAIPIDGDIEMIGSSVLATSFCEKNSALANAEDANPRCETLADSPSCEKSDCDNAAAAGEEENLDLENPKLVTSQDSVCAPAAANSEESPEAILQACKASQDKAERNEDGSVEVASENLASAVICPSSPQRNSCRQLRPSRDIQPINRSPSSTPVKQRHTRRLRPSFGVQPVMSSTFTVMSSVKITSRPQSALNTVIDLTALDDSSSESDPSPRPGSRKRAAPKESLETAKRAKEYSEVSVSQSLRPRRPTKSSTEESRLFQYEFDSVQRKCKEVQRDVDNLEVQLQREVKELRSNVRIEVKAAEDWFKQKQCDIAEQFETDVHDLSEKFQLDHTTLQKQWDDFKADLENAGLVNH